MFYYVVRTSQVVCLVALLGACGPLIADYSLEAYKNATSLKAETEALVDKSGQPFTNTKKEIEALTTKINAAYEFAAGTPYNQFSAQQWQALRDPDGTLYGSFLRTWKVQGTVSVGYRSYMKSQLDEAFDYIICLEANKQAATSCGAKKNDPGTKDKTNDQDTHDSTASGTNKRAKK